MNINFIHPTAIVAESVKLGTGNYIGPFCYITGDTVIGDNNRFEAYCTIGTPAEHRDYFYNTTGSLSIGSNNIFREYSSVNIGSISKTVIGNNVTLLTGAHVSHDCVLDDKVTLSHNVVLGGHSIVMEGVNLGIAAICHQYSVLGAYSMIGMGSVVTKSSNITPGNIYIGSPTKYLKQNIIGLERNNINNDALNELINQYIKLK